jgi:hypothetical protein
MNYKKFLIVKGRQSFKAGAVLGLTTNIQKMRASALEKVHEGVFKVVKPVAFGPKEIIFLPSKSMTGFEWDKGVEVEELDMALDYGARDPEGDLATDKAIAHLGLPDHSRKRTPQKKAA